MFHNTSAMFRTCLVVVLSAAMSFAAEPAAPTAKQQTYTLDKGHSTIGFSVAHLGISSVDGKFKDYTGSLVYEGDKLVSAEASIDVNTIFTDDTKRDDHLKADDFFSAAKFGKISFKSNKIVQDGKNVEIQGTITIRDKSKDITLKGKLGGFVYMEMYKVHKTGLKLTGTLNRQDFGLKFNQALGTGELMVGDEVELIINLEANRI